MTRTRTPRPSDAARTVGADLVNVRLIVAALAIGGTQLFVIPLVLLPRATAWGWTLVPLTLTTTPFWSLIHEAVHGSLLRNRTHNDRVGRVLAVVYGSPFAMLKVGHLLHHRYSRVRERSEIYDPARTSRRAAAVLFYLKLFGGLYLLEVIALLLAPMPERTIRALARRVEAPDSVGGLVLERLAQPAVLSKFRTDAAAIGVIYAAAFLAYGAHGWMLLAAIGGRALIISLSDNAYHYGTDLESPRAAMNLRLPRILERCTLSFTLHDVHHRHPGLRWYELRSRFDTEGGHYHLGWFRAVARQLRGPIASTEGQLPR
ncbi:fatty acid desaturase family protein [Nocardia alba]|uniref:Fatty acid desaturase n=1 Tax=Nocardia alba TaxID=225051 RepID=A0A4R1FSK3_9NOCA|nr:fatty acid desaturase [Nocardia alba]TCJ96632.1 fatty acid desaturase [Nocardia alba]